MRISPSIWFDSSYELETLKEAFRPFRLLEKTLDEKTFAEYVKMANALENRQASWLPHKLRTLKEALTVLRDLCLLQAKPDPAMRRHQEEAAGTPVFMDIEKAIQMVVETRQRQARKCQEALSIIEVAEALILQAEGLNRVVARASSHPNPTVFGEPS